MADVEPCCLDALRVSKIKLMQQRAILCCFFSEDVVGGRL